LTGHQEHVVSAQGKKIGQRKFAHDGTGLSDMIALEFGISDRGDDAVTSRPPTWASLDLRALRSPIRLADALGK
jgi:hypothetical protein